MGFSSLHAWIRPLVPEGWLRVYHRAIVRFAAWMYRYPSREAIIIGVTGTKGKTTTSYLIAKALEGRGEKTACATTALMKIGADEWTNTTKMTMLGRFALQKFLRKAVHEGCRYIVVETSSQGLEQQRHLGIAYDIAVFTNLTPEHIEAHGGFEAYRNAKSALFSAVAALPPKILHGETVPKAVVLNASSEHSAFYGLHAKSIPQIWYGIAPVEADVVGKNVLHHERSTSFEVDGTRITVALPGDHNLENALAALSVGRALGHAYDDMAKGLAHVRGVVGRSQYIDEGQSWTVIVDYAHEPSGWQRMYDMLSQTKHGRVIHVFGSCGGGRDTDRQDWFGKTAAEKADIAIVTNEDPYDDDPQTILQRIAKAAKAGGMIEGKNLFVIEDRRQAIERAMGLAKADDVVLLTGKGSEAWMCMAHGKKVAWDEAAIAREAIHTALQASSATVKTVV